MLNGTCDLFTDSRANCNCHTVQFGSAAAHRWLQLWERVRKTAREGVWALLLSMLWPMLLPPSPACLSPVCLSPVCRVSSAVWHLLLLWSAHQARIKCNMNVSVSVSAVVAVMPLVAAHKLRLVLCLCVNVHTLLWFMLPVPLHVPVPVSLFSTHFMCHRSLHNAYKRWWNWCKLCLAKVKGSIKNAAMWVQRKPVKILQCRLSSVHMNELIACN